MHVHTVFRAMPILVSAASRAFRNRFLLCQCFICFYEGRSILLSPKDVTYHELLLKYTLLIHQKESNFGSKQLLLYCFQGFVKSVFPWYLKMSILHILMHINDAWQKNCSSFSTRLSLHLTSAMLWIQDYSLNHRKLQRICFFEISALEYSRS